MAHAETSAETSVRAAETIAVLGAGSRLKLVTNSWMLAVVEAGAEAIALAEGLGVDPGLLFQAIDQGPPDLPYLRGQSPGHSRTRLHSLLPPQAGGQGRRPGWHATGRRVRDLPITPATLLE